MLEENLKVIKDAKLDIELLRRQNETICRDNDFKIGELNVVIGTTEKLLEEELEQSGEKKLECKLGYASFREMPDKWEYDEVKIIAWCKKNTQPYYHTKEILERIKIKNAINNNTINLNKPEDIPGLKVTSQEPKFGYKIK